MDGQAEGPEGTPITTPAVARPYTCLFCQASFRRDEHLQRHVRCHTGEKKYRCPCGMAFARNDVFVRHMRGCQIGFGDNCRRLANKSMSRTKTKRACDECAKAKAKCDHQKPCERCRRKSLKCEKTRNGYEDPYSIYSIQNPTPIDIGVQISAHKDNMDNILADYGYAVSRLETESMDTTVHVSEAIHYEQNQAYFQGQQIEEPNNMALTCLPSPPSDKSSETCFNMPHLFADYGLMDDDDDIALEADPTSIYFASVGNLEYLFNSQNQSKHLQGLDSFSFYQPSHHITGNGFSLTRLDPLEAKCNEIIELLKRSDPLDSEDITYTCITRHNMVHLCHLYGKHFQHNLPIIHSPTFDMQKSPSILLLAIMLVGACYSEDSIPPAQVTKLAMRLLTVIGAEPKHEKDMQCPSISIIQAGILVCCILCCSQNVAALKSVRLCFAKNFSMCERADLFRPMDSIDYTMLTEETFNWNLWIEQESRRRIACEMFCQDMVHCVFLGRSPRLNPSLFLVELPSYETCWEAETAPECLQRLQSLPLQMRVSNAIGLLTSWPDTDAPLFEASGFGMHVLVMGLHSLLHQATQGDIETSSYVSAAPSAEYAWNIPDSETTKAIKRLHHDHSGPSVTAIADRVVRVRGSPTIRRINNALDSWRTTWDLRKNRDSQREDFTFKGDPLPFWWLAKLYLVLHYGTHILQADSEFTTPRAEGLDGHGKTAVQRKIVGWLSSFRGQRRAVDCTAESWLPDLMKPSRETT